MEQAARSPNGETLDHRRTWTGVIEGPETDNMRTPSFSITRTFSTAVAACGSRTSASSRRRWRRPPRSIVGAGLAVQDREGRGRGAAKSGDVIEFDPGEYADDDLVDQGRRPGRSAACSATRARTCKRHGPAARTRRVSSLVEVGVGSGHGREPRVLAVGLEDQRGRRQQRRRRSAPVLAPTSRSATAASTTTRTASSPATG